MRFSTAKTKYVRISAKKARLVADLIRGHSVEEAISQLIYCRRKAGPLLKKTLNSAIANAETQLDAKPSQLKIFEIRIDEGPAMKRAKSRSRGSRVPILKRSSHFTIVLATEK